jgi:predicted TIM-barrel fold metal-dependent hydrolase
VPGLRYTWLEPGAPDDEALGDYGAIRGDCYRLDDYLAETRRHDVRAVVHVQAAIGIEDPVQETRWLQAAADRLGVTQGIVAYADLTSPGLDELLRRHLESPGMRGIRDLRSDDWTVDPRWEAGFARLGELGLVCCASAPVERFPALAALARRNPQTTLCLDHAGFPRRSDAEYFRRWRAGIAAIAAVPSTVVKISGLGHLDPAWTADTLRPWVLACIEAFGVRRAFFGSNWPVDRLFGSFGDALDAYAELISDLPGDDQRALFSGNAERVFRLDRFAQARHTLTNSESEMMSQLERSPRGHA